MYEERSPVVITNHKDSLKTIVTTTSFISGFLIFCGALYYEIYYKPFGINIFNYLEIGDVLSMSVYILIPILIRYFCVIIIVFIPVSIVDCVIRKISHPWLENIRYICLIKWGVGNVCLFFFSFLYIRMIYLSDIGKDKTCFYEILSIAIIIVCATSFFVQFRRDKLKYLLIIIIITFLVDASFQAYLDRQSTIRNNDKEKDLEVVEIKIDKDSITTNSHLLYIGRTNNYVFLYDKIEKCRTLIPTSIIKEISFRYEKK